MLFDFKNKDGVRLQGILAVPDDYKPGEKRPMIVTFYEKNSQNMHVYTPPVYMVSMGRMPTQATSDGYLTMMPDVHFRTGSSATKALLTAASRRWPPGRRDSTTSPWRVPARRSGDVTTAVPRRRGARCPARGAPTFTMRATGLSWRVMTIS